MKELSNKRNNLLISSKKLKYFGFIISIALSILSCTNEDNSKIKADFTFTEEIDRITLTNQSTDIDGKVLTCKWVSMCDTIQVDNIYASNTFFPLPNLKDSSQLKIKLIVSNGNSSNSITKNIPLPKTTFVRLYGLGKELVNEQSNNVSYNWYYDQMNSGAYSNVNCGPTSVTMALKWAKADFTKTPVDARNVYRSSGGWWYTDDIINYLNQFSVTNYTIAMTQFNSIQSELNAGNIAILCLDMYYIRSQEKDKWHLDKFYTASTKSWGHFIVIKGYKTVDNNIYYEVYDPYCFGMKYTDGTFKGKDRYYRSEDLNSAVSTWWNYAIIVTKTGSKGSNNKVDVNKIKHNWGL
jgi:hypothetical protein